MEDFRQFYATHSIMTDPGEYGMLFNDLPDDIPSLCQIIQSVANTSLVAGRNLWGEANE